MSFNPEHVKFINKSQPKSGFDIISLQGLYKRDDEIPPIDSLHLVEFYILIVIEKGSGKHTIDFTTYDCCEGSILTVRKGQIHRFHKSKDLEGTMLLFTDDFLVSYLEHLEAQKTLQLFNEQLSAPLVQLDNKKLKDFQLMLNQMLTEYETIADTYSLGIIRSQLHILLAKLFRIKTYSEQTFEGKKYVQEFIAFQTMVESSVFQSRRVSAYASKLGKSTKTLNNITRQILNLSAKDFIDDIGIQQIKRLLINTTMSITEIAYESGFEETTNFYKFFKRLTNSTPEEFRSNFR